MAAEESPGLAMFEDFVPNDPRARVLIRLGGDVVRLFPGSVERPVADIDRAHMVADAIDDVLIPRLGFGVRHLLEVALRYADHAIRVLEPAWSIADSHEDSSITVSESEFTAAKELVELGTPESLTPTPETRRALEWVTCKAADLQFDPHDPNSSFGRFMLVRGHDCGDQPRWLPLAFLPEAIGFGVTLLAAKAESISPKASRRFAQLSADRVRRALWHFSPTLLGPPDLDDGPVTSPKNVVQWVSRIGDRRALAVQVQTALTDIRLPPDPAALTAARNAGSSSSFTRIPLPASGLSVEEGTEIVPLMVVSNSGHVSVPQSRFAVISLDDLRWIASPPSSNSDLFMFCRDICRDGLAPMFAFEGIDQWEWWKSNGKSMTRGGISPTFMTIAPHHGNAEWDRAAKYAGLEHALAVLGLFPLRDADAVEVERSGPESVYQYERKTARTVNPLGVFDGSHERPPLRGWTIHAGTVPVAVQLVDPAWERGDFRILHDLAGALAFGFRQIDQAWSASHESANVAGYIIELSAVLDAPPNGAVIWLDKVHPETWTEGSVCRVVLNVRGHALAEAAADDILAAHWTIAESIGDVVRAAGLGEDDAGHVAQSWKNEEPTLVVNIIDMPTARHELVSPIGTDDAAKSVTDRLVAEVVSQAGVRVNEYRGDEAKRLDKDLLAPAALGILNKLLAGYDVDDLVGFGMLQLERCVARQNKVLRKVADASSNLKVEWDPLVRHGELSEEYLTLRRCIETIVEASLRLAPNGSSGLDTISWIEILAAAQAYLEATTRSEQLHHQLNPTVLKINDLYEITVTSDESSGVSSTAAGSGVVYNLDWAAFKSAHAVEYLSATDSGMDDESTASPKEELVDQRLDDAMLSAFGASGSDLLATLFALASWPLTKADLDVVTASVDEVYAHVSESTILGQDEAGGKRISAAITLLTSTTAALQEIDWKPWQARSRKRRVLVQPLVAVSDWSIVVAPHLCLTSLTVYRRYFDQGQLPWSQPVPPTVVDKALASIRDSRNIALEKQVAREMRGNGWSVIENVKETKPKRLNVPSLSTEIDAVAGRDGDRTIWLLEVKDPAETFAAADTRRLLDTFYVDGKKKAYSTQLERKFNDLSPYAPQVAEALNLAPRPADDPYIVRPLFVTRRPVPAAYIGGPFSFASLKQLADLVSSESSDSDMPK